ncbi:hypothetical protein DYQ05_08190 [Treponema pedis]|nr:hypothetical protein DYQ05_08190 [Treponema pedis]
MNAVFGVKSAVLILVYFHILCNNKGYKKTSGFLRAEALSSYFEDRKGHRKERNFSLQKCLSFPNYRTGKLSNW